MLGGFRGDGMEGTELLATLVAEALESPDVLTSPPEGEGFTP
jgi:hypothetical protein